MQKCQARSTPGGVQLRIELSDETPNEVRLRFGVAYQPLVPEDGDAQFEAFVVDEGTRRRERIEIEAWMRQNCGGITKN